MKISMKMTSKIALLVLMVGIAILSRLIPHWPNMTAIGALALFAGAWFERRAWAPAVPLAAMVVSDLIFGAHPTLAWVYAGFIAVALVGMWVRPEQGLRRSAAGAVSASLIFFAISNLGVWMSAGLYAPTAEGLFECYVMALPFLGYQLAGDLIYSGVFLAVTSLVTARAALPAQSNAR